MKRIISLSLLFAALAVNSSEAIMSRIAARIPKAVTASFDAFIESPKTTETMFTIVKGLTFIPKASFIAGTGVLGTTLAYNGYKNSQLQTFLNNNTIITEKQKELLLQTEQQHAQKRKSTAVSTAIDIGISGALSAVFNWFVVNQTAQLFEDVSHLRHRLNNKSFVPRGRYAPVVAAGIVSFKAYHGWMQSKQTPTPQESHSQDATLTPNKATITSINNHQQEASSFSEEQRKKYLTTSKEKQLLEIQQAANTTKNCEYAIYILLNTGYSYEEAKAVLVDMIKNGSVAAAQKVAQAYSKNNLQRTYFSDEINEQDIRMHTSLFNKDLARNAEFKKIVENIVINHNMQIELRENKKNK